jgi:glucose/mannose-6-phosphate isomerase
VTPSDRLAVDDYLLDDPDELASADAAGLVRAVAAAPAQFREAAFIAREVDLTELVAEGRPRAICVVGMGAAGLAGDVLSALGGQRGPVPVVVHRGYGLPGWVGPADLVVPVSASGETDETLSAAEEALRRGARVFSVGRPGSPLAERTAERGPFASVADPRDGRAGLWQLAVPLVVLAHELGLAPAGDDVLEETAVLLETLTDRYGPARDSFLNPAKALAVALVGRTPLIWGSSPSAGVAADRFAAQLAGDAKTPAVSGLLPDVGHNALAVLDMPAGRSAPGGVTPLHVVVLREADEVELIGRRADALRELAAARDVAVDVVTAEGESPVARLASLVAFADFTAVYLSVLLGVDPTATSATAELKTRTRT